MGEFSKDFSPAVTAVVCVMGAVLGIWCGLIGGGGKGGEFFYIQTHMHAFPCLWRVASRVMPQSPHETGHQKRGFAHGGRKRHSFFFPSVLPFSLPPTSPSAGRTSPQGMRQFAISPGSTSICLSASFSVSHSLSFSAHPSCCRCPVILFISSIPCGFPLHPFFSMFC